MAIINDESESYASEYTTIHNWATSVKLVSISAVYTQSRSVFETDSLESLKEDLVVTATYDNGTSEEITNYFLNGELAEGTSTITVTYNNKTATFAVTVKAWTLTWDYTDGGMPATVAPNDWLVVNNTANATFESGKGIKYNDKNNNYNHRAKNYQYTEVGVAEATFNFLNAINVHQVRVTLGTATNCIIALLGKDGVLINSSTANPIPNTVPSLDKDYTLRVERNASSANVYLNRTLVYSGELRSIAQDNNMMIGIGDGTTAVSTIYMKSCKFYHES